MIKVNFKPMRQSVADAIGLRCRIRNTGNQTISRCELFFEIFDKNGMKTRCLIHNQCTQQLTIKKPLPAGKTSPIHTFLNVWYSTEVAEIRLIQAELAYENGERKTLHKNEIDPITKNQNRLHFICMS